MKNELKDFRLEGEDGNAFFIIGRFRMAAKRAGWTKEEIEEVTDEATKGDYHHLIQTFLRWSQD